MEAITQKMEDDNVLQLSDMFTPIPGTVIRRVLRENGGDMERAIDALVKVNDKYVEQANKQQASLQASISASTNKGSAPSSAGSAAPQQPSQAFPFPPLGNSAVSVANPPSWPARLSQQDKSKQIQELQEQVNKVDSFLQAALNPAAPATSALGQDNVVPLNVIAAQQTLEAEIKKAAEDANNANEEDLADAKIKTELEQVMQKSNKTPVNAETFAEWKSKRLALLNQNKGASSDKEEAPKPQPAAAEMMAQEKKALEDEQPDLTQSLARSVAAPSPAKFISSSSILASVISEENNAIERISSQLSAAYARVFKDVDEKLALQAKEIERLSALIASSDETLRVKTEENAELKNFLEEQKEAVAAKDEQIASLKSQDEKQKAELAKNKEQIEDLNKSLLNAQSKLKEAVKLSLSVSAMNASTVNPAASAASSANEIKANVTNAPPSTAPKEIAEQIKSTFDKGVTTALAAEGMNQMLDINRISNAIKKEVAIAFLKDLNSARKAGDETANLSMSSLGMSRTTAVAPASPSASPSMGMNGMNGIFPSSPYTAYPNNPNAAAMNNINSPPPYY